jgi:hypothetical protein
MDSVKGKCRKCGKVYGYYAGVESARDNVGSRTFKKGGNCDADI